MRSLIITKMVPFPADDGGKLRSQALTRALARRGEVVVCGFSGGSAGEGGAGVPPGVEVRSVPRPKGFAATVAGAVRTGSLGAGRFWSRAMGNVVAGAAATGPFDVAVVEYPQLGVYRALVRPAPRCTVLAVQNVESDLVRSYAGLATGWHAWALRAEAAALRRLERREIQAADIVAVVTERDRKALPARPRHVLVCPNGWDSRPPLPPATEPAVIFVGLLGWPPNADAAVWLGREVWPLIRSRAPGAHLLLVGRDPTPDVRRLAAGDITVTGTVADVRPFLARARAAVAPLRAGGGSRLKVLEALDAGRPVVGTTKGLEGLEDLIGRGAVAADGPVPFADAVVSLLADGPHAEELGRRGHQAVAEWYGWDVTLGPLMRVVDELAASSPATKRSPA